jgi:PAS domain-containing protein
LPLLPSPDIGDFAEFAEALHGRRERQAHDVHDAFTRVGDMFPDATPGILAAAKQAVEVTLGDLESATEELRIQNEALFSARAELEESSALFRDLFELAPSAYLVTTIDTCIAYANDTACTLLNRRKNALVGKPLVCFVPLDARMAFRAAVVRSTENSVITSWPAVLCPSGTSRPISCRMRVRLVPISGSVPRSVLYWNVNEESDEDLF